MGPMQERPDRNNIIVFAHRGLAHHLRLPLEQRIIAWVRIPAARNIHLGHPKLQTLER